uniref:Uncharacterized protein n=1 Tax=Branchiostoma floridae TaxID=7739 RepID=C3YX86_BRAFL|eukprot:XP_002599092.1 hypothetical protein BRAFLDRAFT_81755 [Branchiostoma floridae]
MTELSSTSEWWVGNATLTTALLHTALNNTTTRVQAPTTASTADTCTCTRSSADCSTYIIWAVTGTFLGTSLLCGLIMVLVWRCNLCRFRQATLERVEDRYRVSSLALPPHESLRRVSHRYEGGTRWYAGSGDPHVNLGFQSDETPDDYISGGSRIQMMVENGTLENGHGHERAHAHTFHHYRKKDSNVSNIYENPMSVKRASEALRGRYATFPRAEQPQHKLSTASGMYEMPIDWPGDAPDDRKISSVSSYYESPVLQDMEATRHDRDVLGHEESRKQSTVSGVYEMVEPMSSKRYRSNPDIAGIQEEDADMDHREARRKSTVYDAPMPEVPPREARRPTPVPELPPRQNSLSSPKVATMGSIPAPLPRGDRTPKVPPREPRHLSMAERLVASEPGGYGRGDLEDDQDFEDRERRRKSTVYDAPMPELPPTAARHVSTPEAAHENYGSKHDGDDESISDGEVPPCPFGDAPAPPIGAVPARPTGGAPSPPSTAVPSPPARRPPTFPEGIEPAFPDDVAPPFQDDLAPAFPEDLAPAFPEDLAPAPQKRPSLPAYLSRDRLDSVGSMDTLASEPLSERQTHFEMRKIDFDFIPVPDYPEDDVIPAPNEATDRGPIRRQRAHGKSLESRDDDYYRGYDDETNDDANVTYIS